VSISWLRPGRFSGAAMVSENIAKPFAHLKIALGFLCAFCRIACHANGQSKAVRTKPGCGVLESRELSGVG
jgi:hypothetical protein